MTLTWQSGEKTGVFESAGFVYWTRLLGRDGFIEMLGFGTGSDNEIQFGRLVNVVGSIRLVGR